MILSCKCLNVMVEIKDEPVKFDKRSLGYCYNNNFLSKEVLCSEVIVITKRLECLTRNETLVGTDWVICKCLNCNLLCCAESSDENVSTVLISPELLSDLNQINDLRNSDCFSPIYEVIINWADDIYFSQSSALYPSKFKVLQLMMSEKLDKETKLAEEKIRKFTEDQYYALDEFRTKAHNDFHTLAKILSEDDSSSILRNPPSLNSSNESLYPVQTLPKSINTTLKSNPTMSLTNVSFKPYTKGDKNNISSKNRLNKVALNGGSDSGLPPASYDSEGLFPLEDMDNVQNDCVSDDDLSESEGESESHDEGIYIPHHKRIEMAASLPINVPKFMIHNGSVPIDIINPRVPIGRESENITDIAASIKALAKSVHGDRIFGELPRPRLGSQI